MKALKPKNLEYLAVFLLLIPLIIINSGDSHDWGGDFAMYLQQTHNLTHGISQTTNNYIYNPSCAQLGPKVYPAGFPVLLLPIYAIAGPNMGVLLVYMSVLLIFFALVLFGFFREYFNFLLSTLLVLIVVYHPWVLSFKRELMADIPFVLFMILSLWSYLKNRNALVIGFLIGFTIMLKSIGWVLVVALLMEISFQILIWFKANKNEGLWNSIKKPVIIICIAVITTIGINNVLFGIPSEMGLYKNSFETGSFLQELWVGFGYYFLVLKDYFHTETPFLKNLSAVMLWFTLITGLLGLFVKILRRPGIIEWLFLSFFMILLIYPNRLGGVRLMLPVFPLLLYYSVSGVQFLFSFLKKYNYAPPMLAGLAIISLYIQKDASIISQADRTLPGPQEIQSQEAFAYLQANTRAEDIIVFTKPRVLGFYAQRKSFSNQIWDPVDSVEYDVNHLGATFLLIAENPPNLILEHLIEKRYAEKVWNNEKFKLYKWPPKNYSKYPQKKP